VADSGVSSGQFHWGEGESTLEYLSLPKQKLKIYMFDACINGLYKQCRNNQNV